MAQYDSDLYISQKYRWIENGHIVLWLIKDTCWALEYKQGGIFMIFPTVAVAFFILWRSRNMRNEFFHNIAVCFWILANSIWMLGEFFETDMRHFSVALFAMALAVLIFYYLCYFRKDRRKEREHQATSLKKTRDKPAVLEAEIID